MAKDLATDKGKRAKAVPGDADASAEPMAPAKAKKALSPEQESARARIAGAAGEWKSAKAAERAARDRLAAIVQDAVAEDLLTENKIAKVADVPRMTVRKMLGKDLAPAAE